MAIVKMSRFSLFAFQEERENLLQQMQKFKYIHFLKPDDEEIGEEGLKTVNVPESIVAIDEELSRVNYAIEILSPYKVKESGLKAMKEGLENLSFDQLEERANRIDYLSTYNRLKEISPKKENLEQQIEKLKTEIGDLRPWMGLDTPIKNLNDFNSTDVFHGTIPKKLKNKVQEDLLDTEYAYFEIVYEDKDNLYIFAITAKDEADKLGEILRNNGFSNITLKIDNSPGDEISALNDSIEQLKSQIKDLDDKIEGISAELYSLEIMYEYLNNKKLREMATENFLQTDNLNIIEGYIPTDKSVDFENLIKEVLGNRYYLEISEAESEDENVPILLKNSKFAETFESLTSMYALPRYSEIDPTPFLAPFYLFFFGMMGADIGYGLVMLIGTLFALKKFNLSEPMRKSIRFFHYLSYTVMLWGAIYGSIFGGIIPIKGLIDPARDYNELLIISIAFGIIHIYFALGLKAYLCIRDGKIMDAVYDVGFWLMALTGGILVLINSFMGLPQIVGTIATGAMVIGMAGIVLTGGRDSGNVGARLAGGLYSLYGISSYVGDFVSYSRLMALGLSGGFIASAINMMADMLAEKGIIGIIFAIIIFIVGQVFNLGLSLLGAYVHTIRLTFVEFFGKFYEGGGKVFKTFRSQSKYINLN